ncbi:MAG: aminodeoxychorismate synthase component I [Parasphingopyxis sp.]|uniref:aminodeoxychorismate synthase component I n=1 Tax=Parasphingopyxis sp. TaxID=1920299 RepID=UPI0032EB0956
MIPTDPYEPFVLLDDARENGADARLFRDPVEIVAARDHGEIPVALERLEAARRDGLFAAGYLSYEAGFAFEDKLGALKHPPADGAPSLLWFGLFEAVERIPAGSITGLLPDPAGSHAGAPVPRLSRPAYMRHLTRVQDYIAAGDIYQANFTFQADVPVDGHPLALYARMRAASRAGYGGIVRTGEQWLLSLSPELFFSLVDGTITTRPMKGTAARNRDPAPDRHVRRSLREDPKQRAENLMIVDLLRNDLSRIARPGSVAVPSLFHVESFPTIHQMTSTVTAEIGDGLAISDLLRAIYPCGSITGAPKIRAMEIIDECEAGPRGAYTGSIGWIGPDGDAAFNVAIRTLALREGERRASLGLGSGIVADSKPQEEWEECLAKGAFVTEGQTPFDLIETMRFEPDTGIVRLERHLERLKSSAEALGFAFDRHAARNELQAATFRLATLSKIRLLLSRRGRFAIEIRPLQPSPQEPVAVDIAPRRADSTDFRLLHKTTDRSIYKRAREDSEGYETLLEDEDGYLTEGCFTNIFVERGDRLLTPPLSRGILPGVLRTSLIEEGRAEEADLQRGDLLAGFYVGNTLRGMIKARLES